MKFSKIFSILLLNILFVLFAQGQEYKVIRDLRLNNEVKVKKSLGERWDLGFETTLKLEKDASRLDELDFDLDVEYKPFDFLSIGAGYRLALNQNSNDVLEIKHRYMADVSLDYKFRRIKTEYRARYQNVDDDFFLYQAGSSPKNILRNRILFKYDIPKSKLTPYLFSELYGRISSYYPFFMKLKTGVGLTYNFKKLGKLRIYYRIDRELSMPVPYTYFTLGLGYTYDF